MAVESKVYRQAGLLECYHVARQNVGLDSCVVVAARLKRVDSVSNERLTKEEVYQAVVHVLNTQAALSVRVVRRNDEAGKKKNAKEEEEVYVFERMESVNLEKHVHFLDESDEEGNIAELIQRQFTQPIAGVTRSSLDSDEDKDKDTDSDEDNLLWRLIIAPSNTVLFAWHHCLGDGQSGLAFLRSFFVGLNSPSSVLAPGSDPKATNLPANLSLTAPIEELTDVSVSLRTLLGVLAGLFIPPSLSPARKIWTGNPVPPTIPPFETRARHLTIPSERVSQILTAARAHQTTLTAVLYVLAVNVLSELVTKEDKAGRWKKLSIGVPISLRPLAKVPSTSMGETVSAHISTALLVHNQSRDGEFDWTSASAFSRALHASIPKSREIIGTIKYLNGKYEPFFKGKLGKKREVSLEISNVGVFKVELDSQLPDSPESRQETRKWAITESYFAQDGGTTGAPLKMNVAGSPSGSVNIILTWGVNAVEDAFAEMFTQKFAEGLDRLYLNTSTEKSV